MKAQIQQHESNDAWKRISIIGTMIATIAIPIVVALIGHWYTTSLKEKEFGVRYVELAISILTEEPQAHTQAIRTWAIEVVNAYSSVKISQAAKTQMLNNALRIEPALDGNLKNSTELMQEVEALQERWNQLDGEIPNPLKNLEE